jgi:hypothetical protein
MRDDAFRIFEEFFFVVEDYVDDPKLRDPAKGDLDPEELTAGARKLLEHAGFDVLLKAEPTASSSSPVPPFCGLPDDGTGEEAKKTARQPSRVATSAAQ